MSKRQNKKLNKKAMDLLIRHWAFTPEDFELYGGDWVLYIHCQTYDESWYEEAEPFKYLTGLAQDTLIDYEQVEDDSELGFHIQEVFKRDFNLSVREVFSIFRST
ncbi:hypothetical protein [Acinetobacter baumannii]|uniref:hypothetical protein n=1 Tax=Acinetobacter baumannii TaxID=470 RepID=UPI0024DE9248|nr:hypothetical protein [Acinetobacter baumannii]MDK2143694.1 hypothetical protein [Acinetobacter baumannii]MDK2162245.1 hypothetical protein [Acinetobacter baumannii]MDK2173346.1 hypothetical protein [Acinetobacter baumannii]MDK2202278.1 hypothetical protein [Acinetobacter baumannii]MDK2209419.1 hypothetical protein [Acinetobacter baumannii]